jgi:hypothetical protein
MAKLSKNFLSAFKQFLLSLVPSDSDSAWDDYRKARVMAAQPVPIRIHTK